MDGLRREVEHLDAQTSREGFWDDQGAAQELLKQRATASERIGGFDDLHSELESLVDMVDLAEEAGDEELLQETAGLLPGLESRLRSMEVARMLKGTEDRHSAIVSINPGAGGTEAQDWAQMLMRMYLRWCERRGFKSQIMSVQGGDEAGIKDASILVDGDFAYGFLRAEGGVHRLIRISPFDANARRHTSFAAVYVVPDLEESVGEVDIKPEDLRVDTYRASGAGGQHVNKTESAIRLTHIPTGIVVQCQAERSQHKNRSTAMKMLRGRLYEMERRKQEQEFEESFGSDRSDIAFGSQVRSYTLHPYTMVKDERTDVKVSNAQGVLDGDLDVFIEAYLLKTSDSTGDKKSEG